MYDVSSLFYVLILEHLKAASLTLSQLRMVPVY